MAVLCPVSALSELHYFLTSYESDLHRPGDAVCHEVCCVLSMWFVNDVVG